MNALDRANTILGYGAKSTIARACSVTPGAVGKWFSEGKLPYTEITEINGQRLTSYGLIIESLTEGSVTDQELRDDILAARSDKSAA